MTQQSDRRPDDERRLKNRLLKLAPRPSAQHNDDVMQAARAKAAASRQSKKPLTRWFVSALGIAATVVLAIAITWFPGGDSPPITIERGGNVVTVMPVDGAILETVPSQFEWPASPDTRRYQLNVYNDSAVLLWSSTPIVETTWEVGDELDLPRHARYFWVVDLLDSPGGKSIGPFWFSIE